VGDKRGILLEGRGLQQQFPKVLYLVPSITPGLTPIYLMKGALNLQDQKMTDQK